MRSSAITPLNVGRELNKRLGVMSSFAKNI